MEFPKDHLESLWAPWRVEYFEHLPHKNENFFLVAANGTDDAAHFVVTRGKSSFLLMNTYPYTVGHLMVAPYREVAGMEDLTDSEAIEVWGLCLHAQRLLKKAVRAHGFNIGINLGSAAGAGFASHLHVHVVPRWDGDNNFMAVTAGARILPEGLRPLYEKLLAAQAEAH
jgi:ATP adenylyltransferase